MSARLPSRLPTVLPTQDDLGQMPPARTGRHVARLDMDAAMAPSRGIVAIGEGLRALGTSLQQQQDQNEEQEVQRRLLELEQQQGRTLDENRRTLTGDPTGFADRTRASFTESARALFADAQGSGLSPRALRRLDNGLYGLRERLQSSAFTAELNQRGVYGEQSTIARLNALSEDYRQAPDDEARQRILDLADRAVTLGRQTYGFSPDVEQRLRATARQMIEHDILSRPDGYSALLELRQGDPRVRTPSTGEVSDTQLQTLARRPGMTPEQLQEAVTGLRTRAGALSRLVRDHLAEGVTLTQAQHDALVSFGLTRGEDALVELMPSVNSSGPGRWSSVAATMRTPGGLTAQEQPAPSAPPSTTAPAPVGREAIGRAVMSFFVQRGLTPQQAAAIAGNMAWEGGGRWDLINPNDNVRGSPSSPHSFGIGQWNDRLPALIAYARSQGIDIPEGNLRDLSYLRRIAPLLTLPVQLGFAWQEMQSTEGRALQDIRGATDLRSAVAGALGYHRPQGWTRGNPYAGHGFDGRLTLAQRILQAGPGDTPTSGAPTADPAIDALAGLIQGRAPSRLLSLVPPDRRSGVERQLSERLRVEAASEIERDIESIRLTGEPRRLPDGTTWIDRIPVIFGGMANVQAGRLMQRVAEARAQFQAVNGMTGMTQQQMYERVDSIDPVASPRVRRFASTTMGSILDLRERDSALWASGTYVLGQRGGIQAAEDGQLRAVPAEQDLRIQPAPEVMAAYEILAQRNSSLGLRIGPDGSVTVASIPAPGADPRPQTLLITDPRLTPDDRRLIIEARRAAMERVGLPVSQQRILRSDEAAVLLGLPTNLSRMSPTDLEAALRRGAERATELFGPRYARAAFDTAWQFRQQMTVEQRRIAEGITMPRGRTATDALDREEALWRWNGIDPVPGIGRREHPLGPMFEGFAPDFGQGRRAVPGGTAPPPSSSWWPFGSGVQPTVPTGTGVTMSTDGAPMPSQWLPPGVHGPGGVGSDINAAIPRTYAPAPTGTFQQWGRPTPQDIADLLESPGAIQERFDRDFGPGAAAAILRSMRTGR